jgi:hypothetical protein
MLIQVEELRILRIVWIEHKVHIPVLSSLLRSCGGLRLELVIHTTCEIRGFPVASIGSRTTAILSTVLTSSYVCWIWIHC